MQTLLMTMVLLSLAGALFLLIIFYDMRLEKWNWNILALLFLFFLLNHLVYSFGQIDKGANYYEVLPVPIWGIWCIVGVIDFLLIWEGIRLKRISKEKVNRNSIKEAMNLLPTGICYFNFDGTVKLANTQIYQLFRILAHKDLQELSELRDALYTSIQNGVNRLAGKKDTYIFPDGKVWDYRENEVRDRDGKIYIEAVFMDVTKQYHEKINLTKQTEKLKEISRELRYLSDNVLILTRERDVLAAKTKLHDQMGAGLTAIRQNLLQGSEDYSDAVRLLCQAVNAIWNDNQQPFGEGEFEQFLQDAKTLGVKIECLGSLPKNEDYANIYTCDERVSDEWCMSCWRDRTFYNDAGK